MNVKRWTWLMESAGGGALLYRPEEEGLHMSDKIDDTTTEKSNSLDKYSVSWIHLRHRTITGHAEGWLHATVWNERSARKVSIWMSGRIPARVWERLSVALGADRSV